MREISYFVHTETIRKRLSGFMIRSILHKTIYCLHTAGRKKIFILLLLCVPAFADFSCRSIHSQDAGPYMRVRKVVDGDTFWADNGTPEGIKVRLTGLDAPETKKTDRKEIGYFGKESKDYLSGLLTGKRVRLEYDIDRYDQYHRTLAYVFLEDGTFVNAELIKGGYAVVLTIPPNVKYADEFLKLQRKARRQQKGMWGGKGK
jgi:micrococcal nuclease